MANAVVHPTTQEAITEYKKIGKPSDYVGRLVEKHVQRIGQTGTWLRGHNRHQHSIFHDPEQNQENSQWSHRQLCMNHCWLQTTENLPNRIRITVGDGEVTTRTVDLTTAKNIWNSMLSMPSAKFSALDIGNTYLQTPLDRYEYMWIDRSCPQGLQAIVQITWQKPQWIYLHGKLSRLLWSSPGGHSCKQTPKTVIGKTWLLQSTTHPRIQTCQPTSTIHPHGALFWNKIYG